MHLLIPVDSCRKEILILLSRKQPESNSYSLCKSKQHH